MRKLLRLLLFSLGLLVLLLGLVWLTRRPSDLTGSVPRNTSGVAMQAGTDAASTQSAPNVSLIPAVQTGTPDQAQPEATEFEEDAGPTVGQDSPPPEPGRSDLILDPGDPFFNDAPTQTITSLASATQVVNLRHAHLTFEFVFRNDGPGEVTALDLYVSIPFSRGHQRITNFEFSQAPYAVVTDRYNVEMAHFQFTNLAPGRQAKVSWEGDVEVRAMDYGLDPDRVAGWDEIPPDILEIYTTDESKYRLDSPVIQNAARAAAQGANTPYQLARNVHDFVVRRLSYSNDGQWDDAETVYLQRTGSCSEYSFLYIALCRANGLPARYVAGTRQRKEGKYLDVLFHRWTEVYLPPYGWIPVDTLHDDRVGGPHYDYFGKISDERFATTISGGDSEYLGWNYHYGYRYDDDGTKPEVSRERRFIWEPLPSELRASADSVSGYALPGAADATIGELGLLTTNGSYTWSIRSKPVWLQLDKDEGSTPDLLLLSADTTDLSLGFHMGQLIAQSEELGEELIVPIELRVVESLPESTP
jgi:transglutaminase-like putative cysteine protease